MPFHLFSGGVIIVNATLEDYSDTLNFILDTGSGGISLDSLTVELLGVQKRITDTTITGIGGKRRVEFSFNKKLRFPGLEVRNLDFHINNYEVLSSVYGEHIDGIIGYSFFSRYIVKINFDSLFIDVFSPGRYEYPDQGYLMHPVFTSLPIVPLIVSDKKPIAGNFYFDTGAGLCFLMSERFVKDSSVLLSKRKPIVTQAEGMLGRLHMRQTIIRELKLGPYRFRRVPTYLYDDVYNVTSYPFAGGLIGNEILRKFNLVINYPDREIHLLPNKSFSEPFDYSYTGLGMYYIDGRIVVGEVVRKSPADKAGIKVGDIIIGIDNNLSGNIRVYKNMLQVPFQQFRLIISRDGELIEKTLVTGRIS